jgi:hypothetical protein
LTVQFNIDEFDRLMCELRDSTTHALVTASDRVQAEQGLLEAVRGVRASGNGECFWNEAAGQYRWVLRQFEEGMLRIAVMWSTGTVTGWEHAFWAETPMAPFCDAVEAGLADITSRESAS